MSGLTIDRTVDVNILMTWRMEVLHCVFSIPEDTDTRGLEQQNRRYYERHLADGTHIACMAHIDGEAVGCGGICLYDEMPSPDNPSGRCAYLMNIYVREPFRKQGIGQQIIRWLVGQAQESGITKIYLETSHVARHLYGTLGFAEMEDMMIWTR